MMDFKELVEGKDYDFLRNDPLLKDRILFLTIAGSYAYGTNVETSDMDIRGVVLERQTDTLGFTDFEQYIDAKTDTVIYTLKKFLKLAKDCNPNIIEMLYSKPEHYLYISPLGKLLLDNRNLFLTKRAAYSFGGYANAQLNRLENALARDVLSKEDSLVHKNYSIENAINAFETRFDMQEDSIKTHVGKNIFSNEQDILVDINLHNYPLTRVKSIIDEMNNVYRVYTNEVGSRNHKKDDEHLNKHMMHLIRLLLMCVEILENGTLHTYREQEHDLLMNIRNGFYRTADGYAKKEFYALLHELRQKCDILKSTTKLPDRVDASIFNAFVIKLYKEAMKVEN